SEVIPLLNEDLRVCKPANFPPEAPGRELIIVPTADGTPVAVLSLMGRTFMRPVDCPYHAADRVLKGLPPGVRCVVVDVHAEATADKYLLAHHLRGRVSAVLGTHTHVPTADEQVLPGGTAFQCDVGMTGPHASALGREVERVLSHAVTFVPTPFDVASGDVRLNGAVVEIDADTGRATAIRRLRFDEAELTALPRVTEEAISSLPSPPLRGRGGNNFPLRTALDSSAAERHKPTLCATSATGAAAG